jgi:hypothetical protein
MSDEEIKKATEGDKRNILDSALRSFYKSSPFYDSCYYSPWLMDYDDTYIYFEVWTEGNGYKTYRDTYSFNGTSATFSNSIEEVVRQTEYEVVQTEADIERSLTDKIVSTIEKYFGGSKKSNQIIKQFDDEEMIAIEPLYIAAGEVDAVGDTYDLEDAYEMVANFNKAIEEKTISHGLFHKSKTKSYSFIKAWVNECECTIGETLVKEGQPIVKVQFHNKEAWELRKSGELMGLSIGAKAIFEELEDE